MNIDNQSIENYSIQILHIDNQISFLELTKAYLERIEPFSIDILNDPTKVYEQIQLNNYDIIISDFDMPELDGIKLLKNLRRQNKTIGFIFFTGKGREEIVIEALNNGADRYVKKGRDTKSQYADLVHAIKDVVSQRRIEKRLNKLEQTEKVLLESNNFYKSILEKIEEGYYEVDITGKFTFFNPSFVKLMGHSHEDLMGASYKITMDKKNADYVFKTFNTVFTSGVANKLIEWKIVTKNGIEKYIESSVSPIIDSYGKITGFRGIIRDATQRRIIEQEKIQKLAEREILIKENEELYFNMIDNLHEGVLVENQNGIIIQTNKKMAEMLGYTKSEFIGKHWSELVLLKELNTVQSEFKKRFKGLSSSYETILKTKDNQYLPVIVSATPFRNGVLASFTDITQQKKLENELRENVKLLNRQKHELSELASSLNHDIKNRLHTIIGYAELLIEELNPSYLNKIKLLANSITSITERSVQLAEAGLIVEKKDQINFYELIYSVANSIIPPEVNFTIEKKHAPKVFGDREKLIQVFQNLIENAIIHGNPENISILYERSYLGSTISIINDGKIIPEDIRDRIFERNFSTRSKGSGLGLNIVKRIIISHGWQISLRAHTMITTFLIFIPNEIDDHLINSRKK